MFFKKPFLAAIAVSKQKKKKSVCEGVILCVGEKCF